MQTIGMIEPLIPSIALTKLPSGGGAVLGIWETALIQLLLMRRRTIIKYQENFNG
jgi:hypothetical protein